MDLEECVLVSGLLFWSQCSKNEIFVCWFNRPQVVTFISDNRCNVRTFSNAFTFTVQIGKNLHCLQSGHMPKVCVGFVGAI